MGQRYLQTTREKIIRAQEPVKETATSQAICAFNMIMNGIEWERPHLVVRGFKALFKLMPEQRLDEKILALRTVFIQQIEEEKRKHEAGCNLPNL